MNIDKNYPIGILKGKVGDYVFYARKGKQCMRRRPQHVPTSYSPAQVAQQERIASLAVFYHALKNAGLYRFWQKAAEKIPQTGYNLLVGRNVPVFDNEGRISDFSKLCLTPDLLPQPHNIALAASGEREWTLAWELAPWRAKSQQNDLLMVALMKDSETYNIKIVDIGKVERKECRAVVRIPEPWQEYAHLFCLFYSQDTGKSSAGKYFDLLTIKN